MKKTISLVLALVLCFSLCACGGNDQSSEDNASIQEATEQTDIPVKVENIEIKASPDKYTWYIKNYIGKNAASIGYTSMGGDRMDEYGNGYLKLVLQTPNGEFVDIENEDSLKEWKVIGQSLAPNTEIKYTYDVDSDGVEYDSLIAFQNIEEIVLALGPVGEDVNVPTLTAIKPADRYTNYIREYIGRNLAECGYTSMGGDRMDQYGNAYLKLTMVSTNGDFVDINDDAEISKWVVVAQNLQPNTEWTCTYDVDSDGNEYSSLIALQSIEEILLAVAPVGETYEMPTLVEIKPSDRYTAYIRDYVGRTLSQCGYISMGGDLMNQYGNAYVRLAVFADDGSFVDFDDENALKNYVVTSQSVAPNTELTMIYDVDSDGNEYSSLIDYQNIEEIELYVSRVNNYSDTMEEITKPTEPEESTESTDVDKEVINTEELVDGMRPAFKEAMDAYEAFYDEYCEFMEEYKENPSDIALLTKYGEMLVKLQEMNEAFEEWEDDDLNVEEQKYYLEVNNRVLQKMIDVAN